MSRYRNNENRDRSATVDRADLIQEAGEVFTPQNTIRDILDDNNIKPYLLDTTSTILEPAAGDGNFLEEIVRARITHAGRLQAALDAVRTVYGIEIQEDNLTVLKGRIVGVFRSVYNQMTRKEEQEVAQWADTNFVAGNFIKWRSCGLDCTSNNCTHPTLTIPTEYDLIVGNPPYNPKAAYKDFTLVALSKATTVCYILPTSWKLLSTHRKFRETVKDHLLSVKDLPWATFRIKMRTAIYIFTNTKNRKYYLNGTLQPSPKSPEYRITDPILAKAYKAWGEADYKTGRTKLYVGWKKNNYRDLKKINTLQTIHHNRAHPTLPSNIHELSFPTPEERKAFIAFTATKLSAYLQHLTDGDSWGKHLPYPKTVANDPELYKTLKLSKQEIETIENFTLYLTGKAKRYYDETKTPTRADAIVGAVRAGCQGCGSSSFHKKGCLFSTEAEKTLRDKGK